MIKKLAQSLREYKKPTILTLIFITGEVFFEVLIPFFTADLVNAIKAFSAAGQEAAGLHDVVKQGLLLVAMAVASLGCGSIAAITCAKASSGYAKNLRHDMFARIQSFSFENIDRFSSASLVTRMTTDISNVQMTFMMLIRMAVRSPLMFLFAVIMAFIMGGKLALTFVIVIPVLVFGLFLIAKKAMPAFRAVFKKYDRLNESIEENVRAMRVVKGFAREGYEKQKFAAASHDIAKDFTFAERVVALNAPLMQFCIYTCMIVISWLGAKAIIASGNDPALGLTTGNLTALITYTMQILSSLMMLSMVFAMLTISLSSARRIAEVLEERSDIPQPEQPVMTVRNGAVDFDHVSFVYASKADKKVLDDIDLHIRSGETIGIIGGTGASKSSLVQLIPRLYDVTGGKLTLGGVDVRDYDLDTLRGAVAMVLQKNELFSGTIKENLRWGNENATDEELQHACVLACADEFISAMPDGYDTHIEQGGTNVSGGQKQRLCIARALLKKPKVLILDDSTSAVDTRTDAQIQQALSTYIPDTTKIIIAQRISSVQNADRIVVLDDGRIDAVGCHDELLRTCEIYREVYESQQKGGEDDA